MRSRKWVVVAVITAGVGLVAAVTVVRSQTGDDPVVTSSVAAAPSSAATPSATPSGLAPSPRPSPSASPTGAVVPDRPTTAPTTAASSGTVPGPEPDPGPAVGGRSASVTTTFGLWDPAAAEVQVGGYVDGLVETGGRCTLTLTRDGRSVAASTAAVADATTTSCGTVTIAGSAVASGTWTADLSYSSPTSSGAAAPMPIEIP